MRIYIIHSPKSTENYFDKILAAEQKLTGEGHHVMNPLPDNMGVSLERDISRLKGCEAVYAMEGWDRSDTGNAEMSEAMICRKTIMFEQGV